MTIPPVTPGEPIKFNAADENAQRDFINLLMQATGYDNGGFGSTGFSFLSGFAAPHAFFKLKLTCNDCVCYVVWDPDDEAAPVPPGLETVPDVPYSFEAKRVWLNHDANTYGQEDLSPDTVLYFPGAKEPNDVGGYSDGDRAPAWYDEQSSRWWSLNKPGTLNSSSSSGVDCIPSSSSSGVETSSSSGSSGSSSSGIEESSSSSGVCDTPFSGTFVVGNGLLTRVGNVIEEGRVLLTYENGLLCAAEAVAKGSAFICCDLSSSSGAPA